MLAITYLGDVVRHVVDDVHVQLVRGLAELLRERLSGEKRHARPVHASQMLVWARVKYYELTLPVDPGVVGCCGHGCEIVLALLQASNNTREKGREKG